MRLITWCLFFYLDWLGLELGLGMKSEMNQCKSTNFEVSSQRERRAGFDFGGKKQPIWWHFDGLRYFRVVVSWVTPMSVTP